MSNSYLNNLPENVRLVDEAIDEFLKLDNHQQRLVFSGIKKIARDPVQIGKDLGNRGKGKDRQKLVNFKSVRIDKSNIRIIWTVPKDGQDYIDIAIIAGVGPRSEEEVYTVVASRRESVAEFQKALLELVNRKRPE